MSNEEQQSRVDDFYHATATVEESFTKTIICPLETSNRKTEYVRNVVERWQEVAAAVAPVLKSYRPSQWRPQTTPVRNARKRLFPEANGIKAHAADIAAFRVAEAYSSWQANGRPSDNHPAGQFGDGNYATLRNRQLVIEENDRGYGVKVGAIPYNPEWFHIPTENNPRLAEYLARTTDPQDVLTSGRGEPRIEEDETVRLHLSITDEIEVYEVGDVDRFLGIDLGVDNVYITALVNEEEEVSTVHLQSGAEFEHHRKKLQQKRKELQQKGDKPAELAVSDERLRYTDHMTHVYSREVVDIALDASPCVIVLEDLTNYRETATDAIHEWPYAQLQENIAYKATEAGIPTVWVDPQGTSTTCRKCGCNEPINRDGSDFTCLRCGYHVHADVNAAVNVACRGMER